jgi:hypothetical protein
MNFMYWYYKGKERIAFIEFSMFYFENNR